MVLELELGQTLSEGGVARGGIIMGGEWALFVVFCGVFCVVFVGVYFRSLNDYLLSGGQDQPQYYLPDRSTLPDYLASGFQAFSTSPIDVACNLLLYKTATDGPIVYSAETNLADFMYVRPFVSFSIVEWTTGYTLQHIRFVLTGAADDSLLDCSRLQKLIPGNNFVPAVHWLSLGGMDVDINDWECAVYLGDTLLQRVRFSGTLSFDTKLPAHFWRALGQGNFRQYIDGDGELSDQLVALLDEPSPKQKRSLDDLLQ